MFLTRNPSGARAVADYRIYQFEKARHIVGPPVVITCDADEEAVAEARQYVDGVSVEVWEQARIVASLPATE